METKTKIVCTLGPASKDVRTLTRMGRAGMDVVRLNFSHGTHEDHERLIRNVRLAEKQSGKRFTLIQDLQGPKIRVGNLPEKGVRLAKGATVVFTTSSSPGEEEIPVTLARLHRDVKKGEVFLFDDGKMEGRVSRVVGQRIHVEVVRGGVLLSHKGLNIPESHLRIPALSEKDRKDVRFGVKMGVDYVALSFVRSAEDVRALRRMLDTAGSAGKRIRIIVKIEKREAVDRFDEILRRTDAVMIARGDLGIELPAQEVPVIQKDLIERCRRSGIPVIVATQMLESMISSPLPTRAEVSDVANAVADHADAVMLSGESAVGQNPVQAVQMMNETIRAMEASRFDDQERIEIPESEAPALGPTLHVLSESTGRPPILFVIQDDGLLHDIARERIESAMFFCTTDELLARQVQLRWGIETVLMSKKKDRVGAAIDAVRSLRRLKAKQTHIVLTEHGEESVSIEVRGMSV